MPDAMGKVVELNRWVQRLLYIMLTEDWKYLLEGEESNFDEQIDKAVDCVKNAEATIQYNLNN